MRARSVLLAGVSLSLFVLLPACGGGDQANLFGSQGAGGGTPGVGGGNGTGGDATGPGGASTQGPGGAAQGPGGATGKGGGPGGASGGGKGGTTSQGGAAPGAGGSPPGAGGTAMMGKGGATAGKGGSGTAGSGTAGSGTAGSGTAGSGTAGTGASGSNGGTGGTGAAGAPSCDAAGTSCDSCATCSRTGACAGAWDACKNNPECVALGACVKPCGTDQGCLDQCGQDHPSGIAPFNKYVDCAACVACPNDCAGLVMCTASSCNPETQSGCSGADSKCTLTSPGGGGYQPTCVAPMSTTVGNGTKCVRMNGLAGYDDCAAGDFCTFLGASEGDPNNPVRFCRAFCASSGSCGANKTCVPIDNQTPPDALCLPTCTPFKGQCGNNGTCAGQEINVEGQGALVCRYEGNGFPGTPCGQDTDCGKEHVCVDGPGGKRCRGLCDAAHPCLGLSCQMSPALPAGIGVCTN